MNHRIGRTLKVVAWLFVFSAALDFIIHFISWAYFGASPSIDNTLPDWAIITLIALIIYGFAELIETCQKISLQLQRLLPKNIAEKESLNILDIIRAGLEKEDISPAKQEKVRELLSAIQEELSKEI